MQGLLFKKVIRNKGGKDLSGRPPKTGGRRATFKQAFAALPKPVKEGQELDVTIEALGSKGDGIAKIQGFIIFVPETRPGDQVKVKISVVRPNFAIAQVVKGTVAEKEE